LPLAEDVLREKILPQNQEAEGAILGSMLIDDEAIPLVVERLNIEAFYHPGNRMIYKGIITLFEKGKPADIVTLTEVLKSSGDLEKVGGAAYLAQLTSIVPTSANVDYYIRIVQEKFTMRQLIHTATHIIADGYEPTQEANTLLDRAEALVFEISANRFRGGAHPIREIVKDCIETIDRLYQRKENITGIPTGFHEFDMQTAGLQRSDLVVIAARPAMGKSAFVANIAEHVAIIEKIPTLFFSLEMSKEQLAQRMLCSQARVNSHKVRTGFLAQSDWPKLTAAASKLSEAPLYIDDTAGISILELRAKARRLKSQHDIQLLILDYLQLMRSDVAAENRQQEISIISRSLKALARELRVPIIAVSQLSRAVENRADHRPQLSDLRESGAIEQDSDLVVLLMREEYYNQTEENRGLAEINIAKQRNGPVGTVKLTFLKELTRFENVEIARAISPPMT
jgi:replicative DNA helicase